LLFLAHPFGLLRDVGVAVNDFVQKRVQKLLEAAMDGGGKYPVHTAKPDSDGREAVRTRMVKKLQYLPAVCV
jgi:hypothetical protein